MELSLQNADIFAQSTPPPSCRHDPFISRAMGPNPKCERMRAGSLRVGGQGEREAGGRRRLGMHVPSGFTPGKEKDC